MLPAAAYTGALPADGEAHRVQARLVYDLGRAYDLTHFVVGQGMDSAFKYKLWYAEVYVSSDPATLYAAENRVAAYSYVNEDGTYGRHNGGITDAALVLIGYANDPQTQYRPWAGQVYVSETLEELYDDSSLWGSWSYVENGALLSAITDKGVLFETEQPRWGRYVSLVVPVNYRSPANAVRFLEIGIYAAAIEAVGSQIRTGDVDLVSGADTASARADIRFATAVRVSGVAVDAATNALDISSAYLTVGGERYPVSGMGTLVAHDASAYNTATGTGTLVYTAALRDVPRARYTEPLVARGYIRYDKGNGESGYLYGDILRRNIYDVWRDTVLKPRYAANAAALGSNMAATRAATEGMYQKKKKEREGRRSVCADGAARCAALFRCRRVLPERDLQQVYFGFL